MSPRKPWAAVVVALAAGGALVGVAGCAVVFYLMFIGVEREVVAMPGLAIAVVDEDGAPVPGAQVVVEHRTEPHSRLETRQSFTADASGAVAVGLQKETERVMPLCMHGVPGHRYLVCIHHPGAKPVLVEVAATDDPIALAVALRRDPTRSHDCAGELDVMLLTSRTDRPDIGAGSAQVLTVREP